MPDHIHALISFPNVEAIQACWRDWKRYTAKTSAAIWQRDIFEHRIRNDENWLLKAAYIRENPVRKKLVARADDWRWKIEF